MPVLDAAASGATAGSHSMHDAAVSHDADGNGGTGAGSGGAGSVGTLDAAADDACPYAPMAASGRMLGGDILDVNASEAFSDNLAELGALHGSYLTLHLPWTAIETSAGSAGTSGTLTDPGTPPTLATFNDLANAMGTKLSLTLRPVDATGKTVPSDLASTPFDDASMIARGKALVDFVLSKIEAKNLVSLMIGNEIDGYDPGGDATFWSDYGVFVDALRAHVHATHPDLIVGFTATLGAWTDSARLLAASTDAVGVTYYPLEPDFTMRDPGVVGADIAALVAAVPADKPIHIQEIGYATSATTASSEARQAAFYCEVMHTWDTHAERIPRMAFLRLNDVTSQKATELAGPYGISVPAFTEYLRTLGLRTETGTPKAAHMLLEAEAAARGF